MSTDDQRRVDAAPHSMRCARRQTSPGASEQRRSAELPLPRPEVFTADRRRACAALPPSRRLTTETMTELVAMLADMREAPGAPLRDIPRAAQQGLRRDPAPGDRAEGRDGPRAPHRGRDGSRPDAPAHELGDAADVPGRPFAHEPRDSESPGRPEGNRGFGPVLVEEETRPSI